MTTTISNINPTIEQACLALAPEDSLDQAIELGEELGKDAEAVALGRRIAAVSAAYKLARLYAAERDASIEGADTLGQVDGYLETVAAWLKKPGASAEKAIDAALRSSDLISRVAKPALGKDEAPGVVERPNLGDRTRKVCYYTMRAALASKPSDAGGALRVVAFTVSAAIADLREKPSDWAIGHVVGVISSQGL